MKNERVVDGSGLMDFTIFRLSFLISQLSRASPLHSAFLGSVDLGQLRGFLEQKAFDVIEKEILSVRVGEIEAVVVDYLRLFLQPRRPAGLADLGRDSLTQFVGQR